MDPIVYAIPVFFALMALEAWIGHRRGRKVYRLNDALASISLGTLSQLTGLLGRLVSFGIYLIAFEYLRVFSLPADAWWVWLLALICYDFLYYWHHRLGHEVALLWAAHAVHHQSEEFNLSTALRQTSSGFLFGWVFYLPMALLGFPPLVFVVVALIDLLYQYWIHTEQIGRLGWFDRIFASPSNHRVHHAINDRYLDRNYGGILIIWDRIFGSFQEEDPAEPVVYGTRSQLSRFEPISANLQVYGQLWQEARSLPTWGERFELCLRPPGWRAPSQPPRPAFRIESQCKFDPPLAAPLQAYALVQFALVTLAATLLLGSAHASPTMTLVLWGGWCVLTLVSLGSLLEGQLQPLLEGSRQCLTLLALFALPFLPLTEALRLALIVLAGVTLLSGGWLWSQQRSVAASKASSPARQVARVSGLNVEQTTSSPPNGAPTAPRRALGGLATNVHEGSRPGQEPRPSKREKSDNLR
jgi:sterol desaturase/sphingolipid hydroxylase (fatty acid hydroxylase superfamily)